MTHRRETPGSARQRTDSPWRTRLVAAPSRNSREKVRIAGRDHQQRGACAPRKTALPDRNKRDTQRGPDNQPFNLKPKSKNNQKSVISLSPRIICPFAVTFVQAQGTPKPLPVKRARHQPAPVNEPTFIMSISPRRCREGSAAG